MSALLFVVPQRQSNVDLQSKVNERNDQHDQQD
jgi:hypothetical protein